MAYITASDIKAWLAISATGDDTLLGTLATTAQQVVEAGTGAIWEAATATKLFHAVEDVVGRDLVLGVDYLQSITTLTNGDGVVLSASDYVLVKPARGASCYSRVRLNLLGGKYWSWSGYNDPTDAISIAGSWGFTATVPAQIKQLTIEVAAWLYRQRDNGAMSEILITTKGGQILQPSLLPRRIRADMAAWRGVL